MAENNETKGKDIVTEELENRDDHKTKKPRRTRMEVLTALIEEAKKKKEIVELEIELAEILLLRDKPDQLRLREIELNNWFNLLRDEYGEPEAEDDPDDPPTVASIMGDQSKLYSWEVKAEQERLAKEAKKRKAKGGK